VHMEVRQDVVEGVCDYVGEILTHQFSPAIVALNHGKRTDTPGIWAVFEKPKDLKAEAERIAVILNDVGLAESESGISEAYVYESLAVPIPAAGEKRFIPAPKPEPVQLGPDGKPLPPKGTKPPAAGKEEEDTDDEAEEAGTKPKKIEASAVDYLRNALAMFENNAPINEREGDLEQAELERRDAEDIRRVLAKEEPTTLEKLSGAVLEGLTGTRAEWLAPVRPWFDKLLAAVADETATEEDFEETLRKAHRELPELFGVLDTQALQEAMENAIGSAMLAGGVSRYEKK
jgi:phage gp29-like protein